MIALQPDLCETNVQKYRKLLTTSQSKDVNDYLVAHATCNFAEVMRQTVDREQNQQVDESAAYPTVRSPVFEA